jgi:AraC-like DNA-binding protein
MQHAQTLLIAGGLSIGEIAAVVGYTSDSSFIRAFKRYYGYAPGKMFTI